MEADTQGGRTPVLKHIPAFLEHWKLDKLKALQRARRNRRDAFLWHPRAVIELRELIERKTDAQ
jgi:hypothetical protein